MKQSPIEWTFERSARSAFVLRIPFQRRSGWEAKILVTSDQHWDNPKSDHALQLEHLEQAAALGAPVLSAGDFFCLMQGKYDKRSNKSALRPEHQTDNYLDSVIETAVDFFAPYAKLFTVILTGNHEAAIQQRHETNMIDRFCGAINTRTGSHVHNGGFSSFIKVMFEEGSNASRPHRFSRVIHVDHGYGGGGPVTADMIQSSRRAMYLPDADIIIHGHTHDQWVREYARKRLSRDGQIYHDVQTHVKVASYKDGYSDGHSSWEATKGMPPKPLGAYWLRFYWDTKKDRVFHEVIRAQ